eukprot:14725760-Alexandrium_andersonii.AAC.1
MPSGIRNLSCAVPEQRYQNGLQTPPCKASSGGFGVILRTESDGEDETGRRARRRRFSGGVRIAQR